MVATTRPHTPLAPYSDTLAASVAMLYTARQAYSATSGSYGTGGGRERRGGGSGMGEGAAWGREMRCWHREYGRVGGSESKNKNYKTGNANQSHPPKGEAAKCSVSE